MNNGYWNGYSGLSTVKPNSTMNVILSFKLYEIFLQKLQKVPNEDLIL